MQETDTVSSSLSLLREHLSEGGCMILLYEIRGYHSSIDEHSIIHTGTTTVEEIISSFFTVIEDGVWQLMLVLRKGMGTAPLRTKMIKQT